MIDPRFTFSDAGESRPLRVPQGVFILRYISSPNGLDAPEILIATSGTDVEMIDGAHPYAQPREAVLGVPGDALVLRAARDTAVFVTILPGRDRVQRQASIGLERISSAARPSFGVPAAISKLERDAPFEILAHVAHRGDVVVKAGDWICGPQFPMAIEGIEIRWPGAHGVEITTTALVNARGRVQIPPRSIGQFAGSRGKSAPIVGLGFALGGPAAARHALHCEALFLGAAIVSRSGPVIDLRGPTGHEPLVGLRLWAAPAAGLQAAATQPQPYETASQPLARPPAATPALPAQIDTAIAAGRVRVFRTPRSRSAVN